MFTPRFLIRTGFAAAALVGAAAHAAEPESDVAADAPEFVLTEHRIARVQPIVAPVAAVPPATLRRSSTSIQSALALARAPVLAWIRSAEARYGLPVGLLDAVVATESAYMPFAVSSAGAAGLAQLMPATATELGVRNRFDPAQSIDGGARYLRQMLDRFGTVSLALAAYNAGPGAVARAGGVPGNRETPAYVARVIARWLSLQR